MYPRPVSPVNPICEENGERDTVQFFDHCVRAVVRDERFQKPNAARSEFAAQRAATRLSSL
jgi:hypothetical protein